MYLFIYLTMTCVLGSRAGNIVLLQFLVGLKDSTKDDLISELVVSILKSSPDVLARYLKESVHSYIPRPKSAWQDNISLLKKVSCKDFWTFFLTLYWNGKYRLVVITFQL